MSAIDMLRESAVLIRVTLGPDRDERGKKIEHTTEVRIRCAAFTMPSSENLAGADQQTEFRKFDMEPCLGARGSDRVRFEGVEWHFQGPPREVTNLRTGEPSHARSVIWRSV